MPKDDLFYLRHIADAIARIREFLEDVPQATFRSRRMIQNAVVRELEIIGEATRNLPDEFRGAHPDIEWGDIIAMRNRLVHAYFDVDLNVVWEVIHNDLPALDAFVRRIIGGVGD